MRSQATRAALCLTIPSAPRHSQAAANTRLAAGDAGEVLRLS